MPTKAQPLRRAQAHQDDAAHQIVVTTHPHVEVLASPGSGKTHALIIRLQHLLDHGALPQQILVLSFSNGAVRELRRRMDLACTNTESGNASHQLSNIRVCTAHAFARSLLRSSPALLTDKARQKLLNRAIKLLRQDLRGQKVWSDLSTAGRDRRLAQINALLEPQNVRLLLSLLDYARAANMRAADALAVPAFAALSGSVVIREIGSRYQQLKRDNASMDFGDMLRDGERRLRTGKVLVPYTHVLVDEFQDCSAAQTRLLAALVDTTRSNIMVFGDPLQALYGFAGAQYQGLAAYLNHVLTLRLPVSHRLTGETAALASVIAGKGDDLTIQSYRTGPRPVFITNSSQMAQAAQVLADIQQLIDSGTAPQDIGVLARTKAMLAPVEASLLLTGRDTQRIGQSRTHQHVLNVLRMVQWLRRWHAKHRPIESEKLAKLDVTGQKIDVDAAAKEAKALMAAILPTALEGQYLLCRKAYLRLLGGQRQNPETLADVNRWRAYCRQYADVRAMRESIQRIESATITTATIHAAKGREWKHVFVVGVTDGLLPIFKAIDDASLAEERNALYVAVTRAKDSVRLYHAPTEHPRTRKRFEKISRFMRGNKVQQLVDQELAVGVTCN